MMVGCVRVKQRLNVPGAMIDMIHLNTTGNATVKNEIVFKTGDAPRTDSAEAGIAKSSQPAKAGIGGEGFESMIGRFDHAGGGIRIILGDETPNAP